MARQLYDTASHSAWTAATVSNYMSAATGSVSVWVKIASTATVPVAAVKYYLPSAFCDGGGYLGIHRGNLSSGGDKLWWYGWDSADRSFSSTFTPDVWLNLAWVHGGSTLTGYINGSSVGSVALGNLGSAGGTFRVGRAGLGGISTGWLGGDVAEVATWSESLTADSLAALAKGMSPLRVRPGVLTAYWPLLGRQSPELNALAGSALTSDTGTPIAARHPPIRRAHQRGTPRRPTIVASPNARYHGFFAA